MCHTDASTPPPAAGAVPAASSTATTLTSTDGTRVLAHVARAAQPGGAGMVVLPDVRGLHTFYRDLAERFAEVGVDAVAVDWFGRTAPDDERGEDFDWGPHVAQVQPADVAADVAAAAAFLRSPEGGSARAVFVVGFCMGGGYAWRQSADTPGLAGAIGFYGRPSTALEAADRMRAPLLMLVAGADEHIPVEDSAEVARAAEAAGVEADLVVFDEMPHSFFDRTADEHAEACADAWQRIQAFVTDRTPA
jgi:carboxymethylenebutenolidase